MELLLLGLLALAGGTYAWNAIGSNEETKSRKNLDKIDFKSLLADDPEALKLWESLSDYEKKTIAEQFVVEDNDIGNLWGIWGNDIKNYDADALAGAISEFDEMQAAYEALPTIPDAQEYWNNAEARAAAEYDSDIALIAEEKARAISGFDDELRSLGSQYNTARSGILSSQYQQNTQLMDTFTSQMEKSNRNALEAGASAGIRLAGNINTLLSVQNQQSRTSLETANQLAQMMVNQRNAEASVNTRYNDYMAKNRASVAQARADRNANAYTYYNNAFEPAQKSYDSKYGQVNSMYNSNPIWNLKYGQNKSQYNKTGG